MPEHHQVPQGNKVRRRRRRGRGDSPEAISVQEGTAVDLIALQKRVGNRAVQTLHEQRLAQRTLQPAETRGTSLHTEHLPDSSLHSHTIMRQGLLNAGEIASAVGYSNQRYDSRSVRIIQIVTGADVDGSFGEATADAVAEFQDANPPLVVDGKVGENT